MHFKALNLNSSEFVKFPLGHAVEMHTELSFINPNMQNLKFCTRGRIVSGFYLFRIEFENFNKENLKECFCLEAKRTFRKMGFKNKKKIEA